MSNVKQFTPPHDEPNPRAIATNGKRGYTSRPRSIVGWGEVNNQRIRDAIVAITDAGCAIMFGRTSDKGALSILVLDGDKRIREWPHTADEADQILDWLADQFALS